jgi:hypothetical protein
MVSLSGPIVCPHGNTTVVHIATALVIGFWPEDPGIAPQQTNVRFVNVEQSKADSI